jgi:hypothetical protein
MAQDGILDKVLESKSILCEANPGDYKALLAL